MPVKVGTKINAGHVPFTISKVGKPDWGDEPFQVTFKTDQDDHTISEICFLNADGSRIQSSKGGGMRSSQGTKRSIELSYKLEKKVESFTVEIDYWQDLKNVTIPFDIRASVGF